VVLLRCDGRGGDGQHVEEQYDVPQRLQRLRGDLAKINGDPVLARHVAYDVFSEPFIYV